jgi:hypothetical protein
MYSIIRTNARVIQAHYEKGKFIIRKTEHISFEKKNMTISNYSSDGL